MTQIYINIIIYKHIVGHLLSGPEAWEVLFSYYILGTASLTFEVPLPLTWTSWKSSSEDRDVSPNSMSWVAVERLTVRLDISWIEDLHMLPYCPVSWSLSSISHIWIVLLSQQYARNVWTTINIWHKHWQYRHVTCLYYLWHKTTVIILLTAKCRRIFRAGQSLRHCLASTCSHTAPVCGTFYFPAETTRKFVHVICAPHVVQR